MIRVSVAGATGYMGAEVLRYLCRHSGVSIKYLTSERYAGKEFSQVFPNFKGILDIKCYELNHEALINESDIIFLALPHKHSMQVVPELMKEKKKIIDLSADYRIKDHDAYQHWYKENHTDIDNLKEAIYGIPELNRNEIINAQLVANPGCYPTGAILATAPLVKNQVVYFDNIVIDSKSGVSGAGRKLDLIYHFSEVNENITAYQIANHRHTPEIEQTLAILAGEKICISFTPHLIPVNRGIFTTAYLKLKKNIETGELIEIYREFYKGEKFVRVLGENELPATKAVFGSNFCDLTVRVDKRTKMAIALSCIDNIGKGGSGQAVQNMNIMCGFDEIIGLESIPIYP